VIFSVVIPTCGRGDLLARCLESLQPGVQSADAATYEVIVTDDARGQTAEGMIREKFPWARWVQGPSRGPAANRNNGARHAQGEWICFIDDDCIASKEWLAAYLEGSRDASLDVLEGRTTIPDKTDNPFQHAAYNENGGAYWSCNLAIRRERFLAIGGFDEDFLEAFAEDMEFAHRFKARQYRAQFFPEALVYHPVRTINWRGVWKRILMIRWSILYAYKVDLGLHPSASAARNVLHALVSWPLGQLRASWRDLKRWRKPNGKSRLFWFIVRWVSFPVIYPYYLYWVYRFHEQLEAKKK
jgi:GT2 family glycosyltransferase